MRVLLALLCLGAGVALADYMYRPPPHLMPHLGHGPHGPHGHKHHPFVSGKAPGGGPNKHGPPRHPPPPHYHGRPHHRPRKPPAPPSPPSPWKTSPYKTTKDPFRAHEAAALSAAIKSNSALSGVLGGTLSPVTAITSSPLSALSAHVSPLHGLHTYTNVISDDHGPIHTIPAPNLSPADKPSHLSESSSYASALEQHALQRQQAIQSALHQLQAASAARPSAPTTASPLLYAQGYTQGYAHSPRGPHGPHAPHGQHGPQGYQVSEAPSGSQEGMPQLYAPDPDPSRPAPKLKPTTDPHSLPSEGRGPHFSIDPQFGAVSSQPGYMSTGPSLSPQDLFHLLNGFPLQGLQGLQQDVQPHVQIMHHGLSGDTLTADHQHLLLQQQHLQQLQQQQLHHHLHHLQPADFQPQYQSFDFDEQSYQKSLFQDQGQDHEVSEDAPRPSVQRPDSLVVQEPSPSASTVSLYTVSLPQPTGSSPTRGDVRAEDEAGDEVADDEEYDDVPAAPAGGATSTTQAQVVVTPAPQSATSPQDAQDDDDDEDLQQAVIREDADTYVSDPSLVTPFRRQPNSVHVPDAKQHRDERDQRDQRLPYGARIRPKRIAVE